jgi:hypothetical protein
LGMWNPKSKVMRIGTIGAPRCFPDLEIAWVGRAPRGREPAG